MNRKRQLSPDKVFDRATGALCVDVGQPHGDDRAVAKVEARCGHHIEGSGERSLNANAARVARHAPSYKTGRRARGCREIDEAGVGAVLRARCTMQLPTSTRLLAQPQPAKSLFIEALRGTPRAYFFSMCTAMVAMTGTTPRMYAVRHNGLATLLHKLIRLYVHAFGDRRATRPDAWQEQGRM